MLERQVDKIERSRLARILLSILVVGIVGLAASVTFHSAMSVDGRTQIEMLRGVADHGLPYTTNGPVERFPDLQARWQNAHEHRLWGFYPPLFAYASLPFFQLGGLVAVSRATVVWAAFLAIGAFFLARRIYGSELPAALAAYVSVFSTPILASSFDLSPFIHTQALIVWATYFAVRSLGRTKGERVSAAIAGIFSGLAIEGHMLAFPMAVGLLLGVSLAKSDDVVTDPSAPELVRWLHYARSWLPTRASLFRGLAFLLALVVTLLPLALLNHVKFGSYNPISYGPCVWRSCAETGVDQQTLPIMLRYAIPPFLWLALTLVGLWLFRRDRPVLVAIAVASLAVFIGSTALRIHLWNIVQVGFGYLVDIDPLTVDGFGRPPDHVGVMLGPFLVRSVLQETPLLALVFLVRGRDALTTQRLLVLLLPTVVLLGTCALRANEPMAYALGFPYLYLRYTVPGLVALVVAAGDVARRFEWKRAHAYVAVGLTAIVFVLLRDGDDGPLWRRLFLLYATLAAALACVLTARRKSAPWAATFAFAIGVGATLGQTVTAMYGTRVMNDARVDHIAADVPQRFALVAFAPELDTALTLRATRDIQYLDLYESDPAIGWTNFRSLIDVWTDDGRPVYALWPPNANIQSPWPEVVFEDVLPSEHLVRVRKR